MTAWLIAAALTWFAMLIFTDFVLWDDELVAIIIGLIVAALLCLVAWPIVWLAGIGTLIERVVHR